MKQQLRVLYREFLFRIVDRDLLSSHAKGDASQLLLQLVALVVFLSICLTVPAFSINSAAPAEARLLFALNIEHFLIATTMLVVGVFAVLAWDSMFPGHRDVLVLAPLPIRAHTILLAKLGAVATASSLTVVALHVVAGAVWPLALHTAARGAGGVLAWARLVAAYWFTMISAGVFVFGLAMSAQGIAAAILPRRIFLRVSSILQLGAFCLIVGAYFLQPMLVRPATIVEAQQRGVFASSPSYWFLGLFQEISGATAFAPLARSAWAALALVAGGTALAYTLSYFRTLRQIAEKPDIAPAAAGLRWLPAFGEASQTAVVQFSIRTLLRSAQHRIILAFYWGMGFALAIIFLKSPRGQQLAEASAVGAWHETSLPLLISSIVMMGCAVVAARLAFAMPRDLPANWIFRILPVPGGPRLATARRRALLAASVAPVVAVSALAFLGTWPWRPAAGHLAALSLLGLILVELCAAGTPKIPFTCSYLPGKSRMHIAACIVVLLLPLIIKAAIFERDALRDPLPYTAMLAVLGVVWVGVRAGTSWLRSATGARPEFEDEPAGQTLTLELWDSRFAVDPQRRV